MTDGSSKEPIVTIDNVSKRFVKSLDLAGRIAQRFGANIREEVVHAVDGVSLKIQDGEVVGLVGESGSGKSTLGRVMLRLLEPSKGKVYFNDIDITHLTESQLRPLRRKFQMIFQDPMTSFDPIAFQKSIV